MRRRDFLKGIAAICGAAALPVAAKAITATRSESFEVFDDTFVLQATADDNALRELRRLLHEAARKHRSYTISCIIDAALYDRIMRRMDSMERVTTGEPFSSFRKTHGRRPMYIDGHAVMADESWTYRPERGHSVSFQAETDANEYYGGIYGYSWRETITPAILTAPRG